MQMAFIGILLFSLVALGQGKDNPRLGWPKAPGGTLKYGGKKNRSLGWPTVPYVHNSAFFKEYGECLETLQGAFKGIGAEPQFLIGNGQITLMEVDSTVIYSDAGSVTVKGVSCVSSPETSGRNTKSGISWLMDQLAVSAITSLQGDGRLNMDDAKKAIVTKALRACKGLGGDPEMTANRLLNDLGVNQNSISPQVKDAPKSAQ